jgi:alkylation response protein AidB-like acyl-CoA dehydrogenase
MVYLMHLCGIACYAASPGKSEPYLRAAARGRHPSTLAFSEQGSRSHFWAPVSRAVAVNGAVRISAKKSFVTSAGHADGYAVSTLAVDAVQPVESTIYLVLRDDQGVSVSGAWHGLGMRGNARADGLRGMHVEADRASPPGWGLDLMSAVLRCFRSALRRSRLVSPKRLFGRPWGTSSTRLEHMNSSLAEFERCARVAGCVSRPIAREHTSSRDRLSPGPGPTTQLLVLEAKAATGFQVSVTDAAMRTCGGAGSAGTPRRAGRARPDCRADERPGADFTAGLVRPGLPDERPARVGAVLCDPKVRDLEIEVPESRVWFQSLRVPTATRLRSRRFSTARSISHGTSTGLADAQRDRAGRAGRSPG